VKKCNDNFILAIETSCDDTSIALFKNNELLSLSESTSIKEYQKYGGIIPEIASRKHEECINEVYLKCLSNSKIEQKDINYIAYTAFPGLPGSLHVGKIFAKTLSFLLKTKLIPVDHMMGHAFSFAIENPLLVKFPLLSLVVSGGNTILYLFSSLTKYVIVNQTVDDPLGECLDKIGRMIGLGYPGGVSLDKNYDESKSNLQLIKHLDASKPFSFSGIKSFAHNYVNTHKQKNKKIDNVLVGSSCLK
jgi:N6-L-threonylcarbamoyladenine synthase